MSQLLRLLSAAALPLCRAAGARARLSAVTAGRYFTTGYPSSSAPNVHRTPANFLSCRRFQSTQRRLYSTEPKGEVDRLEVINKQYVRVILMPGADADVVRGITLKQKLL
ncbi:hypothetical protein INR49_003876 [Caranx melampygus]|nr:hypothetical protein INR49_003876 [Caranx melampygus]